MVIQALLLCMKNYLSLIKFSHTIFALPFAILGFFLAVKEVNKSDFGILFLKVIACMVFARSAAMAFNRYVDRDIDKLNPRTSSREIPLGIISPRNALLFTLLNVLLFCFTTYLINPICFYLSPLALLIVMGYSYTKRFTLLCHFILGLGLSLAPIGAYLAVTGHFAILPIIYSLVVLFWVSGFDIIYALQDIDFDRDQHLKSVPSAVGQNRALVISHFLHMICALLIIFGGYLSSLVYEDLRYFHWVGALIFMGMLLFQHLIVRPGKLDRINLAFFTTNGIASLLFSAIFIFDLLTKSV